MHFIILSAKLVSQKGVKIVYTILAYRWYKNDDNVMIAWKLRQDTVLT